MAWTTRRARASARSGTLSCSSFVRKVSGVQPSRATSAGKPMYASSPPRPPSGPTGGSRSRSSMVTSICPTCPEDRPDTSKGRSSSSTHMPTPVPIERAARRPTGRGDSVRTRSIADAWASVKHRGRGSTCPVASPRRSRSGIPTSPGTFADAVTSPPDASRSPGTASPTPRSPAKEDPGVSSRHARRMASTSAGVSGRLYGALVAMDARPRSSSKAALTDVPPISIPRCMGEG